METHTLPAYLAANPEDYARRGIAEHTSAMFEDGLRTDGGPGTYEWWYFDAHLDDGSKLVKGSVRGIQRVGYPLGVPQTPALGSFLNGLSDIYLTNSLQTPIDGSVGVLIRPT
jgi:hypothetical protein